MNQEELRKEAFIEWEESYWKDKLEHPKQIDCFSAGAEWEAERGKWTSVTDALPETNKPCIVLLNGDRNSSHHIYYVGSYDVIHKDWTNPFGDNINEKVTHWMPITPPKTSKQ